MRSPTAFIAAVLRRVPDLLREPFRQEEQPHEHRRRLPELIRRLAIPILVGWVVLGGALNLLVPQLEKVVATHSGPFVPDDLVSTDALRVMGAQFHESDTNNVAFLLLENKGRLGQADRDYYNQIIATLLADHTHVQSAIDIWSDPAISVGVQSADGQAAYAIVRLAGSMGTTQAQEAIDAVRAVVAANPAPPGTVVYVTGPSVVAGDELSSFDRDMLVLALITGALIFLLLLTAYRSLVTAMLPLVSVGLSLAVARPIVAWLGNTGHLPLSMFAGALVAALILGSCTDYSIFILGRYQEARRAGRDFVDAYHDAYHGVAHIVLASGVTIAGACACMSFTQLGMFQTSGLPCAIGILIGVFVSLTATPALIEVLRLLGFLEPKSGRMARTWRRLGAQVARWPAPMLVASTSVLLLCCLGLIGLRVGYNEREGQSDTNPGNIGYQAADRHFPKNRLSPDFLLISADHDLRNSKDLIALDAVAAKLAVLPSVDLIQSVTRPLGLKLDMGSLSYHAGYIGDRVGLNSALAEGQSTGPDNSFDVILAAFDQITATTDQIGKALDSVTTGLGQLKSVVGRAQHGGGQIQDSAKQIRGGLDVLNDAAQLVDVKATPIRQLVDANPNCANEDLCSTANTLLNSLSSMDELSKGVDGMAGGLQQMLAGLPSASEATATISTSVASALAGIGALRASVAQLHALATTMVSLARIALPQLHEIVAYMHELGRDFSGSESGGFYLPEQVFADARFQKAMKVLLSPDGKDARIIVYGRGESFSQAGIDRANAARETIKTAVRGTTLEHAEVRIGGVGATIADVGKATLRDFTVLIAASLTFVFVIVLLLLRSLVAAVLIIGTVVFSYLAALGLSTLFWQHIFHIDIHWGVQEIGFVALVAVGADYNLLFTSRLKDEVGAGFRTGLIRAFGGTGGVVTTAGIVFGITMFAMLTSGIRAIAQVGSTIGLGLILDTLIVRTFLLPSIATLLGRWFWWPLRMPARPRGPA